MFTAVNVFILSCEAQIKVCLEVYATPVYNRNPRFWYRTGE